MQKGVFHLVSILGQLRVVKECSGLSGEAVTFSSIRLLDTCNGVAACLKDEVHELFHKSNSTPATKLACFALSYWAVVAESRGESDRMI